MTPSPAGLIDPEATASVVAEIFKERGRQDKKWGQQDHPDGTGVLATDALEAQVAKHDCDYAAKRGRLTFRAILKEEVAEAFAEKDEEKLIEELTQVAAVACGWIESIRRRQARRLKKEKSA